MPLTPLDRSERPWYWARILWPTSLLLLWTLVMTGYCLWATGPAMDNPITWEVR